MQWTGCTQFGSIGCGVSKAEGNGVRKEKGKKSVGNVKLDIKIWWQNKEYKTKILDFFCGWIE